MDLEQTSKTFLNELSFAWQFRCYPISRKINRRADYWAVDTLGELKLVGVSSFPD